MALTRRPGGGAGRRRGGVGGLDEDEGAAGDASVGGRLAPVPPQVREKLSLLPARPGCYLYRDAAGAILYVGKARSLRQRVRSYFQESRALDAKTAVLVALVADLEWIVTDSEVEALLLENNLIKQHQPRYNIRLRDDKQYPYLRLQWKDPWPRLEVVRRPGQDGARYFGPYPQATAVWETLQTLRRVFPYRSCSDRRLAQPHACLYYHIHRCLAPCIGACTAEAYRQMIGEMVHFLDGHGGAVLARLQARMEEAAEALRFEEAAEARDRLRALRAILEKQKVQRARASDRDALAVARAADAADVAVSVFFVRDGKVAGQQGFILAGAEGRSDGDVLQAFVEQFYGAGAPVPPEILLSAELPEAAEVEGALRARRQGAVRLAVPRRGEKRALIELVRRNAEEFLTQERWRRERSREAVSAALAELQAALGLPAPPRRIECFDNSNIQGAHAVSAMVVFEDGVPHKADYRRFRVRTVVGADDFATMREILGRRFARGQRERAARAALSPEGEVPQDLGGFARLPDLVIIDGGRGQLHAARDAMRALGVEAIPTFGLAKEHEWLFREGDAAPIVLAETSGALRLLQRIRDEAHRFGLQYHRQVRAKASVASLLEEVPGIGPRRRKALLRAFGSLQALRAADVEAVAAVPGIPRAVAEELLAFLQGAGSRES
jgi:excinuclease ABC subunit C